MTELQRTEFELLRELDAVCRKLEIAYFLVCGSALGAVKYGGFIPWDDDIDVAMYREDYERFCQEAPKLLPSELFLQNYHTEPHFPQIYSKLRHSGTTYIETTAAKLPINHGVFIDVFPLDGYPEGRLGQVFLELRKRLYASMLLSAFDVPGGGLRRLWLKLGVPGHTRRIVEAFDRMIREYPAESAQVICNHGNWQGRLDYSPANHFGRGIWAEFEGLRVRVPECYDMYLRQKYGDYTQDPPEDEQVGHHYCIVYDCQKKYTEYFKNGRVLFETKEQE